MTFEEKKIEELKNLLAKTPEDKTLIEKLRLSEEILSLRKQGDFLWSAGEKAKSQSFHHRASALNVRLKELHEKETSNLAI